MTQLLTDLTSMIAMDLVNDLSPSEIQHMKRELGPEWKEQLLTPVMQPITLRSGTVLKLTGGNPASCRAMSRFFARVALLAFLCVMFMMYLQPLIDPRKAAGNHLWMSVQEFATKAWALTESCPVGTKVNTVIDKVCTLYARFKYALETGNVVELTWISTSQFEPTAQGVNLIDYYYGDQSFTFPGTNYIGANIAWQNKTQEDAVWYKLPIHEIDKIIV